MILSLSLNNQGTFLKQTNKRPELTNSVLRIVSEKEF